MNQSPPGGPDGIPDSQSRGALADARRFAERVVASSPHIIYVYDLTTRRIVYVGGQLGPVLGYTPEQILTMGPDALSSIAHPDDAGALAASLATLNDAADGTAVECEWRARHADGSWRWMRSREKAFDRCPDGRVIRTLGWAEDVTARREAELALRASEARFRALVESAAVGVCQTDPVTGRIVAVNDAVCRITGYSLAELQARTFHDITYPGDVSVGVETVARLLSGAAAQETLEKRYVRKDGRIVWVQVVATAVRDADGRPANTMAIIQDVTDRRAAAEALRTLNDTLEARVRERTAALVDSREQLRTLARELTRAEHRERRRLAGELHDHLAQLLAVCQLKMVELNIGLPPGPAKAAGQIEAVLGRAMEYTRTLMSDLSPSVLQARDLDGALRWLADRMREHGLDVRVRDDGRPKPLDDEALAVAFAAARELLFNIVKHARTPTADVWLRARPGRPTAGDENAAGGPAGDVVEVRVTDAGAGFDPAAAPRAPGRRGGFGLFAARERLALLGGRLDVRSAPGRGTVATIVVPLAADGRAAPDAGGPPPQPTLAVMPTARRPRRRRPAAAEMPAAEMPAGPGADL